MVEVRKANDLRDDADKYPVLIFFCDWLLHPVLTFKQARAVLKGVDDFIEDTKRGLNVEQKNINFIGPLVTLRRLQHELAVFLTEHELDTSVVSGEKWFRFLSLYVDQIERAEVRAENPAKLGLKHIDSITIGKSLITLGAPAGANDRFNFRIVWTLKHNGNPVYEIANELWSPATPESVSVPVLNELTFPDGSVRRQPLKSATFFGEKK
jgi:hypothetical protein